MNATEMYNLEKQNSAENHKNVTAGAMVGHVISNLSINQNKIRQISIFHKDIDISFTNYLNELAQNEQKYIENLSIKLISENEIIPTTTEEFLENTMLKESGSLKYEQSTTKISELIQDFDTQLMFIIRAIVLAKNEQKYGLELLLKKLYSFMKRQITTLQFQINNDVSQGLEEE
ncbi:DNA-binding protein [Lactobacillus terrae]|uniref:DNA-binding protein n=1 Tax=Lactobacillus terrae TaxID=2269374 RepID=UPI000C1B6861|nr:DNA-binding protein [Lactobacillus terrae]